MIHVQPKDTHYLGGCTYEIYTPDMTVPAHVVAPEDTLDDLFSDTSLSQLANVSTLPGIQPYTWAMPDMHEGYGFPIGGIAATAIDEGGVISPGGIGYDINCGVRLLVTNLSDDTVNTKREDLAHKLNQVIPSGPGNTSSLKLSKKNLERVLAEGPHALHAWGYAEDDDITFCENTGVMEEGTPDAVSEKAKDRGKNQLATLGSGNHFLEIQKISDMYDTETAEQFGLHPDMITVMIHSGSRGLGHQVCTDYVQTMVHKMDSWGINLPDPALACAPLSAPLGQRYYQAMSAAANFAWANRQAMTHYVRTALRKLLGKRVTVSTVYDICHNIGKKERHTIHGRDKNVLVHRKGATRAFGPHMQDMPDHYKGTGHPVLIPGTMGTSSYVMVGTRDNQAFNSCCHGAGRVMSRRKARQTVDIQHLENTLDHYEVTVQAGSEKGVLEEAPQAYKEVQNVVNAVSCAHLARPVTRMVPRIVLKG